MEVDLCVHSDKMLDFLAFHEFILLKRKKKIQTLKPGIKSK
jgi:hypothetical protein